MGLGQQEGRLSAGRLPLFDKKRDSRSRAKGDADRYLESLADIKEEAGIIVWIRKQILNMANQSMGAWKDLEIIELSFLLALSS